MCYIQDDVERECPDALKWGVLQDVGQADSQPAYVSFSTNYFRSLQQPGISHKWRIVRYFVYKQFKS